MPETMSKVEQQEIPDANMEIMESVERAKKMFADLKEFHNTDVIGQEATDAVEALAQTLTLELREIPLSVRRRAGLPWHPQDAAANDDSYTLAA